MKILWTHNWNPDQLPPLIINTIKGFKDINIQIDLEYLGNLKSPMNLLAKVRHLRKISSKYDLIHSQYGSMCAFISSFAGASPKIVSLHGSDFNINRGDFEYDNLHTRIARLLTIASLKKFNHVITVSERMKNEIVDIRPELNISTIPYPIDLNEFFPKNKKKSRELLKLPQDKIIVLFNAANINSSVKGYNLAKESISIAQRKIPNLILHVVTGIDYHELPDHVNSCDLILLTSKNEGWPNSIKEALACNLPFVSTDVSDLLVIANKESSCRVVKRDPYLIAENIVEVTKLNQENNLMEHVKEMDIVTTTTKLLNLYKDTIENYMSIFRKDI